MTVWVYIYKEQISQTHVHEPVPAEVNWFGSSAVNQRYI
jgi:hypothetical protein